MFLMLSYSLGQLVLIMISTSFGCTVGILQIPVFLYRLYHQSSGRSIWTIITDPERGSDRPLRISREMKRKLVDKGKTYTPRLPAPLYIHSTYQSRGGYMHFDTEVNHDAIGALIEATKAKYNIFRPFFVTPYTFVMKRLKKPPLERVLSYNGFHFARMYHLWFSCCHWNCPDLVDLLFSMTFQVLSAPYCSQHKRTTS